MYMMMISRVNKLDIKLVEGSFRGRGPAVLAPNGN